MAPKVYNSERYDSKVDLFSMGRIFSYTLSDGRKHLLGEELTKHQNGIKSNKPMVMTILKI